MNRKIISLFALVMLVAACDAKIEPADPNPTPHDITVNEGVFSQDGNLLSGVKGFSFSKSERVQVNVNEYLWRASLQSLSFMPLIQADSAGGVILSDWIAQEDGSNQQVKVNLYILSKALEPTALNVKVFTREKLKDGSFGAQTLDSATSTALEEAILSEARKLKTIAQMNK